MLQMKSELVSMMETGRVEDVRVAVQAAIELEHATMPPYLYALYSLGTSNPSIQRTLRGILQEEMLHMLLACNLLNAIGGRPKIHDPAFVPTYPTPLPGTVNSSLSVPLQPFSKWLCEHIFMVIEEPEFPLRFPVLALEGALPPSPTIGVFYARLKESLKPEFFTGNVSRQVTSPEFSMAEDQQQVVDLESAHRAIDVIVTQGEGTADAPFEEPGELAHYYQFAEIVNGRKLIPNPEATPSTPPSQRHIYGGAPITIATGILPLIDNPRSASYAIGTPERAKSDEFNRAYTRMLALLQTAFDGTPSDLQPAIDMMRDDLRPLARELVTLPLGNGRNAGPTFEFLI
jgi:hypothetical protein